VQAAERAAELHEASAFAQGAEVDASEAEVGGQGFDGVLGLGGGAGAARQSEAVQRAYAEGVEGYLAGFAAEFQREAEEKGHEPEPGEARSQAIRLLSELIGAMTIARAVRDVQPGLSDEILQTGRIHALD
jgi:hypothetical protein